MDAILALRILHAAFCDARRLTPAKPRPEEDGKSLGNCGVCAAPKKVKHVHADRDIAMPMDNDGLDQLPGWPFIFHHRRQRSGSYLQIL